MPNVSLKLGGTFDEEHSVVGIDSRVSVRLRSNRVADTPERVGGTSWQLMRFQSSDGTVTPDDRAEYTIAFADDSSLRHRVPPEVSAEVDAGDERQALAAFGAWILSPRR